MTEYAIMRPVFGNSARVEITPMEWQCIFDAEAGLLALLEIEEVWDAAVGNYRDYERSVADALVADLTDTRNRRTTFDNDRLAMSRMLSNLLSSIKAFQDIAAHHISSKFGEDRKNAFHRQTNEQFDTSFGYRVMERLRNHSQHHGMAVTSVSYLHQMEDSHRADGGLLVHRFAPQLSLKYLRTLPRWNTIVSDWDAAQSGRRGRDDVIDLTPHVRDYMYRQSLLLDWVRVQFRERRSEWAHVITDQASRFYEADNNAMKSGVVAMEIVEGESLRDVFLNPEIDEAISEFEDGNRILNGLHRAEIRS